MQFLEHNEIWAWCVERGIALTPDYSRLAPDERFVRRFRTEYGVFGRSGSEPAAATAAITALPAWDECLVWVLLTEVWPSSEDWPAYYARRGACGERRSIGVAPGHRFESHERAVLAKWLTQMLEFGWEANVLPARGGMAVPARIFVSHDGWLELLDAQPEPDRADV